MWRIALAEWRTHRWVHLFGPAVGALILGLIYREFSRYRCCLGEPEMQPFVVKQLFMSLVYCQIALVMWAQHGLYGRRTQQRLTDALPFSLTELNLVRILTGTLFVAVGLVNWIMVFVLWRMLDQAIPASALIFATLVLFLYLLICMRFFLMRYLLPILFPFLWVPELARFVDLLLPWVISPWGSTGLGIVTLLFGWRVVRQPPPRWARS
jgi:hypothetical protein